MTTTDELLEKLRMLKYDYDSMSTSLEDAIDDIAYELEQAIAATLGSHERTCHNTSYRLDESRFHCSECEFGCWVKDVADGRDKLPNYCPNCGAKVVGE